MMFQAVGSGLRNFFSAKTQKVIIRYLLERYIGDYLVNTISVTQLEPDVTNGKGKICDLDLNIEALNEAAEQFNLPFIFVHGFVKEISFSINWSTLYKDGCFIEITGLKFSLQPKERDGTISVDSMVDSMSSSIQIAQDILNKTAQADCSNANDHKDTKPEAKYFLESECFGSKPEGIQVIASFIENFIQNIRFRFIDSNIRIESLPARSEAGIALEFLIDQIDFNDEISFGKEKNKLDQQKNCVDLSHVISKLIFIEGISIFSDEFPANSGPVESDLENSDDEFHDSLNRDEDISSEGQEAMIPSRNQVLLAKLYNKQEVRLQFRKPDIVEGPKTKIDVNLGPLIVFASPRQIHLLMELIEGLMEPEKVDPPNSSSRKPKDMQRPMNRSDFQTVKRDISKLGSKLNFIPSEALDNQEGWSSPPNIYDDELFFPFTPAEDQFRESQNPMLNSTLTDVSDFEASFTSTTSSNIYGNSHKKEDILKNIKLKLNSFCIILLQDDVMIPSHDGDGIITVSSLKEMQKKVDFFFSKMIYNSQAKKNSDEFSDLKRKAKTACLDSHLRLIGTAIGVEATEKIIAKKWQLNTSIGAGWFEMIECLNDSREFEYNDLLIFQKSNPVSTINQLNPVAKQKVQININKYETNDNSSRSRKMSSPKLDVHIILDDFVTEIDISLLDRINALINKQKVIRRKESYVSADVPPSYLDNQAFFKDIMEDNSKSEMALNIKMESPNISMKVRFPVPDLRPMTDMNRVPWWKRNVRDEILWINWEGFVCWSNICAKYPANFQIQSNDVNVLFQQKDQIPPVPILRASTSVKNEEEYNPIRIDFKGFPEKRSPDFDVEPMWNQDMTKSTIGFISNGNNLFHKRQIFTENQEIFNEFSIPEDKTKIDAFINETINDVCYDVNVILPDVKFILPNKHTYEIIYNRVVSDLLLWSSSAPDPEPQMSSMSTVMNDLSIGTTLIPDSYNSTEFKPFTRVRNDEMYSSNNDNEFASMYDQPRLNSNKNKNRSDQTMFTLKLNIIDAVGSIHTPYKDENNKLLPGKYGNISFSFEKGFLFIASGYKGDKNAVQGCIQLNTVHVYHNPQSDVSCYPIQLNSDFAVKIKQLNTVLHPSDFPCRVKGRNPLFEREKECITICFKSSFDEKKNEKLFEATGLLHCVTLCYFVTNSTESWLSQIQDMFNVEDYPVQGYTLPDCVTEINFHFEFCGIDYRPLYLPLKSYLAFDFLSISSNFTVKGNSSVMQLIVEEAAMFLSQNLVANKVNLTENHICVLDIEHFELCLKMDYSSLNVPITELLFSNNKINIRTCADSCKAFMELLIYLSGEGDLFKDSPNSPGPTNKVVIEPSCTEEIDSFQYNQNVLTNQSAVIESRINEAMMESYIHDSHQDSLLEKKCNVNVDEFYFPDENVKGKKASAIMKNSADFDVETALREASNDYYATSTESDNLKNNDEDFCVLDDIPGSGIKSPTGKPKVNLIEPVSIRDEYFDPLATEYETRFVTPKNLPRPICMYNLKMSVNWYMYGGKDFVSDDKYDSDKNGNRFQNGRVNANLAKKDDLNVMEEEESPSTDKETDVMKVKGGPNRCQDIKVEVHLSKIKFKYEIYSDDCPTVSQHIFFINDIVIYDQVKYSHLHKFLFQHSHKDLPMPESSNMIQIKALTQRCDPDCSNETNLNISCRPIKLNIGQDTLLFIIKFIEHLVNTDKDGDYAAEEGPSNINQTPVMSLKSNSESISGEEIYLENSTMNKNEENSSKSLPMYFRNVIFENDVPISIDYHGKHIDLNSQYGPFAGLLIGIGQLKNSHVTLKKIKFRNGVLGINKVLSELLNSWIQDIKQNQFPSIIIGVGPMHSFVTLLGAFKALVYLPIDQYNKDGRVFRGIQRGTSAFTSSSAYAVLDLTERFVSTIQSTAETMYDMVSSGPSVKKKSNKIRRRRPKDIREGVTAAYGLVRSGLGDTASALIKVATEEHSHKGVSGALGGVLRQLPPTVVKPIIIASEATCTVIGGITNQLVPDAGKESADKWKS